MSAIAPTREDLAALIVGRDVDDLTAAGAAEAWEYRRERRIDLVNCYAFAGLISVCPVCFDKLPSAGHCFEFADPQADRGPVVQSVIMDCVDDVGGNVIDLVAWARAPTDDRQRAFFATFEGRAEGLGLWNVRRDALSVDLLKVYRRPEDWLMSRGRGVCLLKPSAATILAETPARLLVADLEHAKRLAVLLRGFCDPAIKIVVHRGAR